MEIIPVIDIRGGIAVKAVAGEREGYRPLQTALCAGCDPITLAQAYGDLFPFQTLYVADLDGIEGRGANRNLQDALAAAWAGKEVWIDDGEPRRRHSHSKIVGVLGSEILTSQGASSLDALATCASAKILSLDFRGDAFLGPRDILTRPDAWPSRLIVMTLSAVGRNAGPDFERVAAIVMAAGASRRVYAAGGVRGMGDVDALSRMGAAGVLVASAFHELKIKTGDLSQIAG